MWQSEGEAGTQTYRLRCFNEDLGASKLKLILVHIDRPQEMKDSLFLVTSPRWPGLFGQDGVPEDQKGSRDKSCYMFTLHNVMSTESAQVSISVGTHHSFLYV